MIPLVVRLFYLHSFPFRGEGGNVGLGLHCMLGLMSAILNKPPASLCLLEVSFLLRLILQRRQQTMTRRTIFEAKKCFQGHEILSPI